MFSVLTRIFAGILNFLFIEWFLTREEKHIHEGEPTG
jgi:hypothetical protein